MVMLYKVVIKFPTSLYSSSMYMNLSNIRYIFCITLRNWCDFCYFLFATVH